MAGLSGLSPLARVIIDHANLAIDIDEYQKAIDDNYRNA